MSTTFRILKGQAKGPGNTHRRHCRYVPFINRRIVDVMSFARLRSNVYRDVSIQHKLTFMCSPLDMERKRSETTDLHIKIQRKRGYTRTSVKMMQVRSIAKEMKNTHVRCQSKNKHRYQNKGTCAPLYVYAQAHLSLRQQHNNKALFILCTVNHQVGYDGLSER